MFFSQSDQGSAAAFNTIPTSSESSLPPAVARDNERFKAGSLHAPLKLSCICGHPDVSISHVLHCKKFRGRFVMHDLAVGILQDATREAGYVSQSESLVIGQRIVGSPETQKRMDELVFTPSQLWIDVTYTNPSCPAHLARSSDRAGSAAVLYVKQYVQLYVKQYVGQLYLNTMVNMYLNTVQLSYQVNT